MCRRAAILAVFVAFVGGLASALQACSSRGEQCNTHGGHSFIFHHPLDNSNHHGGHSFICHNPLDNRRDSRRFWR
ncbi:Hypp4584 [Branchiostoma lanceolatum]|uniref:Hypp4584 protein n=1 Tax=Branchiostoma lanceolatum TaxID=7740 RepID=A0A8K0F1I1_BRALA|nr:Hypp4584 [Branchiostoma lanceolatum]